MRTCSKIGGVVLTTLLVLQAVSLSDAPAQQAPGGPIQPRPGPVQPPVGAAPAAAPTAPAAFPLVQSVSPVSLMQGQAYTLTVVGQNLQPNMQLIFAEGIMVKAPLTIQGPTTARINVQIASGAPPGRYEVKVRLGQELRSSQAFVMIMAAPPPPSTLAAPPPSAPPPPSAGPPPAPPPSPTLAPLPSTAPPPGLTVPPPGAPKPAPAPVWLPAPNPAIASLTPNQWAGGQSYTLTLFGANFASGMEVRFGEGIQTKGTLTVKSATTAEVAIDVAQSAKAGKRTAEVRGGAAQQWASTGASGWVVAASAKPAVDPKFMVADTSSFVQGIIKLKEPEDFFNKNSQTYWLPINDNTVFKWEETNPGLAEWFELRIVTDQGKMLMKRRIDPVQMMGHGGTSLWIPRTYYRPDKKFFDEMFFGTFYIQQSADFQGQTEDTIPTELAGLLLYWEVAGYRGYETVV